MIYRTDSKGGGPGAQLAFDVAVATRLLVLDVVA